jgi:hypothetical protein
MVFTARYVQPTHCIPCKGVYCAVRTDTSNVSEFSFLFLKVLINASELNKIELQIVCRPNIRNIDAVRRFGSPFISETNVIRWI